MLYVNREYTIVEGMSRPQPLVECPELKASHIFTQKESAYKDRLSRTEVVLRPGLNLCHFCPIGFKILLNTHQTRRSRHLFEDDRDFKIIINIMNPYCLVRIDISSHISYHPLEGWLFQCWPVNLAVLLYKHPLQLIYLKQ